MNPFIDALRNVIAPLPQAEQEEILEWAAQCEPGEGDTTDEFVRTIIGDWLYVRVSNMGDQDLKLLVKLYAALQLLEKREERRFNQLLQGVYLPDPASDN